VFNNLTVQCATQNETCTLTQMMKMTIISSKYSSLIYRLYSTSLYTIYVTQCSQPVLHILWLTSYPPVCKDDWSISLMWVDAVADTDKENHSTSSSFFND